MDEGLEEEHEPNNNQGSANLLAYGQSAFGRINPEGDEDWFKFTGDKGDLITVKVWLESEEGISALDPYVTLYDSDLNVLASNDDDFEQGKRIAGLGSAIRHFRLPKTGTYYLKLEDLRWEGGLNSFYDLWLVREREDEYGDTLDTAFPLPPSLTLKGTLGHEGDQDVFRFEAQKGDVLTVVVDPINAETEQYLDTVYNLSLLDSQGFMLTTNGPDPQDMVISGFPLPETGTYYLTLADEGGLGDFLTGYRLRVALAKPPQPVFTPESVQISLTSAEMPRKVTLDLTNLGELPFSFLLIPHTTSEQASGLPLTLPEVWRLLFKTAVAEGPETPLRISEVYLRGDAQNLFFRLLLAGRPLSLDNTLVLIHLSPQGISSEVDYVITAGLGLNKVWQRDPSTQALQVISDLSWLDYDASRLEVGVPLRVLNLASGFTATFLLVDMQKQAWDRVPPSEELTVSPEVEWLQVEPIGGVVRQNERASLILTLNAAYPGTYRASLSVLSEGEEVKKIPVELEVSGVPSPPPPNLPPSTPVLLSPAEGALVSPTPTFRLQGEDPEGGPVKFVIEVTNGSITKIFETPFVASGVEAAYSVPAEEGLSEGQWSWRAQAVDSQGARSDWGMGRVFRVVTVPRYGDVNGDGAVNTTDLLLLLRVYLGLAEVTPEVLAVADVRPKPGTGGRSFGDGAIRGDDLNWLLRYLIGLENSP